MIPLAIAAAATAYTANEKNKSDKNAMAMAQAQQELINAIPLPVLKEYYPEVYKQVVTVNPHLEESVTLGASQMEGISTDPRLRQAQMSALAKLQGISEEGGMTFEDRSRMNQINNEVNTNLQGNTAAIQQNMAVRGMAGGPGEMVARQMAAQGAANRASQQGMDVQAQAQQRALQAIMQSGQLGGQMQAQDFGQQAQVAQSQDAISKFNAANQQQVRSNNVGRQNDAQQFNAQNAQNTSNQNVTLGNQAQQYNLGLAQQNFGNQMAKAGAQVNVGQNAAQLQSQQGASNQQFYGNLIGAGANAYGSYAANQKKKNEAP